MSREEDAYVIERMGKLLAEIAIIVNGAEPHDTLWSYHDLPEKVRALKQAQQPAAAVPEDAIEAAYWDFDARHKGYGPHKTTPQSERDAFKWAVRAMLAAAERAKGAGNE